MERERNVRVLHAEFCACVVVFAHEGMRAHARRAIRNHLLVQQPVPGLFHWFIGTFLGRFHLIPVSY